MIDLILYPDGDSDFDGPKVGDWTVTADVPNQCGNAVLGVSRCLNYHAGVEEGVLGAQMMGLERDEGDRVVMSIPL